MIGGKGLSRLRAATPATLECFTTGEKVGEVVVELRLRGNDSPPGCTMTCAADDAEVVRSMVGGAGVASVSGNKGNQIILVAAAVAEV